MSVGYQTKVKSILLGLHCSAALWTGMACAVEDFALGDEDFLAEMPVILTVSRLPQQAQNLPASVTVIDRQMIEASGAKEIPELLRLVAGFQVGHSNLIGPRATVSYHGMSDDFARRMQVLVDGRSIYTPATGGIDWYGLPLVMEDIERIEVTRGPNGVTYGANSFLGVINILTAHASKDRGTIVKSIVGDTGYEKGILRHAGSEGALDYRISLEYQKDDGNPKYRDREIDAIKDDKKIQLATIRADYRSNVNDYLTFQFGASTGSVGDGVVGDITQPLHENETKQYYTQLKWKRIFSTDNDIELQFYQNYSDSDADYLIPNLSTLFPLTPAEVLTLFSHPDDPVYVPHSHQMRRSNVEVVHRFRPMNDVRVVWGGEARVDSTESPGLLGNNSPVTNHLYRLFANTEWTPDPDWIINAGVMVENNEITDTHLSPRLAVNYRLTGNHTLRAAYSVNYRTPAMLEEYADYGARFYTDDWMIDQIWKSAGGLEAEENVAYELALVGATHDKRVSYDVRFFHDDISNLIASPIDDNFVETYSAYCGLYAPFCRATVLFNDGRVEMSGFDVQAMIHATQKTQISVAYSQVETEGKMLNRLNPTEYVELKQFVPTVTTSALIDHAFTKKWQASVGYYKTSDFSFIGGDARGEVVTLDARLAKGFDANGITGKVSLSVQDIHQTYHDYVESIERARSLYMSAELRF